MMAEVAVVKARTSEKEYIVVYIGYLFQYAILDFFFFFLDYQVVVAKDFVR